MAELDFPLKLHIKNKADGSDTIQTINNRRTLVSELQRVTGCSEAEAEASADQILDRTPVVHTVEDHEVVFHGTT
jgi:hypothetical protein